MNASFWLRTGAIWGFLTVVMGTFGAHGLRGRFESLGTVPGGIPTERLQANFQTAVHYQMYCALAILAVGLDGPCRPERAPLQASPAEVVPRGLDRSSRGASISCASPGRRSSA